MALTHDIELNIAPGSAPVACVDIGGTKVAVNIADAAGVRPGALSTVLGHADGRADRETAIGDRGDVVGLTERAEVRHSHGVAAALVAGTKAVADSRSGFTSASCSLI